MTVHNLVTKLRKVFADRLRVKTGWGRNEIQEQFDEAITEVVQAMQDIIIPSSEMVCHRSMAGLEIVSCRIDCMMYNPGSGRCRENEFMDYATRINTKVVSKNSREQSIDDDLPY